MLTPKLLATSNYSGGRLAFHLLCWDCFRLGVAVGAKKEVRTQESDQEAANTQTYSGGRLAVLCFCLGCFRFPGCSLGPFGLQTGTALMKHDALSTGLNQGTLVLHSGLVAIWA